MSETKQQFLVIGDPITHSKSPQIHNGAYKQIDFPGHFTAKRVTSEDVASFMDWVSAQEIQGYNITYPLKQDIAEALVERYGENGLDDQARKIGVVNTVVRQSDGTYKGHNTDGEGFVLMLQEDCDFELKGKRIVLFGIGGTSKSIAVSLLDHGVSVLDIYNRTEETVMAYVEALRKYYPEAQINGHGLANVSDDVLSQADLVIQSTPLGMSGEKEHLSPVQSYDWVQSGQLCVDTVYSPEETVFLSGAKANGATTHNGASMLAAQAVFGFALMTGQSIDYEFMKIEVNRVNPV